MRVTYDHDLFQRPRLLAHEIVNECIDRFDQRRLAVLPAARAGCDDRKLPR